MSIRSVDLSSISPASCWAESLPPLPDHPSLQQALSVDVAVVGGGYTGLCCALKLAEAGRSVAVLEAAAFGQGASGLNGGQASAIPRLPPETLARHLGVSGARAYWQLHHRAQSALKQLLSDYRIPCDWRPGVLQLAHTRGQARMLQRRLKQLRRQHEGDHLRWLGQAQTRELVDSPRFCGALLDAESAHLHPLKLLQGLLRSASAAGADLYGHSPVDRLDAGRDGFILHCNGHPLQADRVLLACNMDQGVLAPRLKRSSWPLYSFMLATAPLAPEQIEALLGRNLAAFDSDRLVHYWKRSADNRLLFGGADSHRSDTGAWVRLRDELLQIYPQLAHVTIEHFWGGRFALTPNRLPQVGQLQPGLFYAQGYNGDGLTLGCYSGLQIAAQILGETGDFNQLAGLPQRRWPLSSGLSRGLLGPALSVARLLDR